MILAFYICVNFTFRILLLNYNKEYDFMCSIIFSFYCLSLLSIPFIVTLFETLLEYLFWELIEFYLIQVERNL